MTLLMITSNIFSWRKQGKNIKEITLKMMKISKERKMSTLLTSTLKT